MGSMKSRIIVTAAAVCFCAPAAADRVESAYYLCALMDAIGLTSAKCEVSGWNSSVTVSIDMNSSEARKLCAQIAGHMRDKRRLFEDGWTLQITSPFSGGNSIAYCDLPK